jgi:hypothetical protein
VLVHDLVRAEPDAIVMQLERQNVVDKWFTFRMILWSVEHLKEQLFHQSQMRGLFEALVEAEKRPAELEAVASEFELVARVDVGDEELG